MATTCYQCWLNWPRPLRLLPLDDLLDDFSESEHWEQVDNEADLKDEGQHIDPSKTF